MRLFVAVDLPKHVKDYIFELQKKLNTGIAKVGWVHKKNLHLTLKFLGDVEESKVDEITNRLNSIKQEPFALRLSGLGVFPSKDYIKIVWVGINPEDKIISLQQKVDGELLDLFPGEQKFYSHITIGRVKFIKKKKEFSAMLDSVDIEPIEFEVSGFSLMKSELRLSGAEHKTVKEFDL